MTAPNLTTLDQRRRDLLAELAAVEAEMSIAGAGAAQDGHDDPFAAEVTLGQAAYAWGLSGSGAWRRAIRLQEVGLARRIRPGGWRINVAALEADATARSTKQSNRRSRNG